MRTAVFGRVLTAMVTPFDAQGRMDEDGIARMAAHLLDNGSDGIVAAGTTGESPTLSHDEKLRLFTLVKQAVGSRGTVIAGTGGNDTAASIRLTREAAELGVDGALLVVPPYNRPSQEGLYQHFKAIASEVPELPCMLYNVPPRTAQNMDAATTIRLANDVPNIVATKEAANNLVQVAEIVGSTDEGFSVYSGDDAICLPLLAVGGQGVVSVTAHLVGNDIQAMCRAFFRRQFGRSRATQHQNAADCPRLLPADNALARAAQSRAANARPACRFASPAACGGQRQRKESCQNGIG